MEILILNGDDIKILLLLKHNRNGEIALLKFRRVYQQRMEQCEGQKSRRWYKIVCERNRWKPNTYEIRTSSYSFVNMCVSNIVNIPYDVWRLGAITFIQIIRCLTQTMVINISKLNAFHYEFVVE